MQGPALVERPQRQQQLRLQGAANGAEAGGAQHGGVLDADLAQEEVPGRNGLGDPVGDPVGDPRWGPRWDLEDTCEPPGGLGWATSVSWEKLLERWQLVILLVCWCLW